MSITHLKGLKLIPDPRNSGTVLDVTGTIAATVTGDIAQTGDYTITGDIGQTGKSTASGTVQGLNVYATNKVTATTLNVKSQGTIPVITGNTRFTTKVTCTTLNVKSTGTIAGNFVFGGNVAAASGSVSALKLRSTDLAMASAANNSCGIKAIAAASAGVGAIASTKIVSTSRIFLTPVAGAIVNPICGVRAVGTGTASFYFRQFKVNTAATASGNLAWMVVNL